MRLPTVITSRLTTLIVHSKSIAADRNARHHLTLGFNRSLHTTYINMTKALVLGVYQPAAGADKAPILTDTAAKFDSLLGGKLKSLVSEFGPNKKAKAKTYHSLHADYPVVSVVGLGAPNAGYNEFEEIDEKRENIRVAMAIGAKSVRDEQGVDEIHFDSCGDAEAAAEGAHLSLYSYDELKSEKYKKKVVKINVYQGEDAATKQAFEKGATLAKAQNICRRFAEMPANFLTPTNFAAQTQELFKEFPSVKVMVHDKEWAEQMKMGSFLSVAKGSAEPPRFVEIHYNNKPDSKPFVMVGKGICFDSGGISIKPSANMDKMRYDMGGAANVISTTFALAALGAKVNVIALAPMCENLPSGTANKPGDVVVAMNGKTIQVDNTDAEGRLILADGLCYADKFEPQAVLDIATLTGAMGISLGSAVTGVFTPSGELFKTIHEAGVHTGDRVWRMPLFNLYKDQVTNSQLADLNNISKVGPKGGSCTAAVFLSEFVKCPNWIHIDIAGVMESNDEYAYYARGMSGRIVRTLFYFVNNHFKNN